MGAGNFSAVPIILSVGNQPRRVAIGDLNGDGRAVIPIPAATTLAAKVHLYQFKPSIRSSGVGNYAKIKMRDSHLGPRLNFRCGSLHGFKCAIDHRLVVAA